MIMELEELLQLKEPSSPRHRKLFFKHPTCTVQIPKPRKQGLFKIKIKK